MNRTNARNTRNPILRGLAVLALLLCGAATANADGWSWSVTPYAWATDVGVDMRLAGRKVVDETIPVSDLLEDLDTMVSLRLEAQNGAHGVMIDLFDVTLSDEANGVTLPRDAGQADVGTDIGMTILDVAGTFDPTGDRQGFGFIYGVRVIDQRATVDATITPTGGSPVAQRYDDGETLVDGLAGIRFSKRFARRWSYQMQADLSTGGTEVTWSVGPSLGYAFGATGRYAVTAGYRHMTVDFKDDGEVGTTMTLSGLLVGFRTSF